MDGLSIEVLERIVRKLDHISMCRLASMSGHMREGVHSYCSSHLRYLANQDSTVKASLEACGWEAGNDHDMWSCSCIYLVVGPWYWWTKGRKKEVIVDPDLTFPLEKTTCVVVNNKIFTSFQPLTSETSVISRTRDRLPKVKQVIGQTVFPESLKRTDPPSLTNFENTLLVKFIKTSQGFFQHLFKNYSILVYNSESLQKVCDIDVMENIDRSNQKNLEIQDIKMCKNKIAIHLMFGEFQFGVRVLSAENVTQIWSIDTKSPKKESIFLEKTVTYSFDGLLKDEGRWLAMNSRYLVKIGQEESWLSEGQKNIIHYESQIDENVKKNIPCNLNQDVWHASIIPGFGSFLCLGLRITPSQGEPLPNHRYQFIVQVYDLSTEQAVTQKQIETSSESCPNHVLKICKISWWSEHLLVLVRDRKISASSYYSLYTWSPGQPDMMKIRIKLPVGGLDWRLKYFHMDYQGIVMTKARDQKTAFQCYKYEIEEKRVGNVTKKSKKGKV